MIPVVDKNQVPLMPCSEKRARQMVTSKKATPFWKRGIFCIRLNKEPSSRNCQQVAVGVDPGSKKEGFTVKSASHTYLNIQADAVTWVSKRIETRRDLRRSRRFRNTPCRKNRMGRSRGSIPPSTRARWSWKLRILKWLSKIYPITDVVIEDIKARTIGKRRWDKSFSPLQVGKNWFYSVVIELASLTLKHGWETKELRDKLGLRKTSRKLAEVFSAHCVDSWVLANDMVGGHIKPESERLLCIVPLQLHRRMLHRMVPSKGGRRNLYGGTRSMDLRRGTIAKHPRWGLTYVGGFYAGRLCLHSLISGKRVSSKVKRQDIRPLSFSSWRFYRVPS